MSMLAMMGFLMMLLFMYVVMTKRLSAMVALIILPVIFAVGLGYSSTMGKMMLTGVKNVGHIGVMVGFALLFFAIMIDAGMFDPIVRFIRKATKNDPLRVVLGTCMLSTMVALDGDGTTTYMVTCSAMLALHRKLGINPMIAPIVALLPGSCLNVVPWGGPSGRAMSAVGLDVADVFVPLIPGIITSILYTWGVAYYLGLRERRRLGYNATDTVVSEWAVTITPEEEAMKRPQLLGFNAILTIALLGALMASLMPASVLFMIATAIALIVNYPDIKTQQALIRAHAPNALPVIAMIFAAGIFSGMMEGTKMLDAMAKAMVLMIPESLGPHLALIFSFISVPGTYFLSNDAWYFGILPILVKTASNYGITPQQMAIASLSGVSLHGLSPTVASCYLLVGLCEVDYGEFTKYCVPLAVGTCLVGILTLVLLGTIPI